MAAESAGSVWDSALGWIGKVAEWLRDALIPQIIIVKKTEWGVKYSFGKNIIPMPPGIHLLWRLVSEYEYISTVDQVETLAGQELMAKDGQPIYASGVLTYDIVDGTAHIIKLHEPGESVREAARRVIPQIVETHDFAELNQMRITTGKSGNSKLDELLKRKAQRLLRQYGVRVKSFSLPDFIKIDFYVRGIGTN